MVMARFGISKSRIIRDARDWRGGYRRHCRLLVVNGNGSGSTAGQVTVIAAPVELKFSGARLALASFGIVNLRFISHEPNARLNSSAAGLCCASC